MQSYNILSLKSMQYEFFIPFLKYFYSNRFYLDKVHSCDIVLEVQFMLYKFYAEWIF